MQQTQTEAPQKRKQKNARAKGSWQALKALIQLLGSDVWLSLTVVVVFAVSAALGAAQGYYLGQFINDVTTSGAFLGRNLYILLFCCVMNVPVFPLREWVTARFGQRVDWKIRGIVVDRLTRLRMDIIQRENSGDMIGKIEGSLSAVRSFTSDGLGLIVGNICDLGATLAACLLLSWQISVWVLVMIPPILLVQALLSKPMFATNKALGGFLGNISQIASDGLSSVETIKAYTMEEHMAGRMDDYQRSMRKVMLKMGAVQGINQAASTVLGLLPVIVALATGGVLLAKGQLSVGVLVAFVGLSTALVEPIQGFIWRFGHFAETMGKMSNLNEVLDMPLEKESGADGGADPGRALVFEHVVFAYSGKAGLYQDMSFEVKKGETVAFAGLSGCGKSTVLNLVAGFYKADDGQVLVDGTPVDEWQLSALRTRMALVAQDSFLFPVSIGENVRYGRVGATDEEVAEACRRAEIWDFIQSLPEGLETQVGERGVKLSGGQRQRIAIARAFLKNAPILLLDEPTSALDFETEREIQHSLEKLAEGRTTLIIAHRLTTIRHVDRIYCMDNGQIVETGTHEELMRLGGLYNRLYKRQEKEIEDAVEA